jgi:hypothetical protein
MNNPVSTLPSETPRHLKTSDCLNPKPAKMKPQKRVASED